MYYQTQSISKDKCWTSCRIVGIKENKYIVEYMEDGRLLTKEVNPEQIENLDYTDISQ